MATAGKKKHSPKGKSKSKPAKKRSGHRLKHPEERNPYRYVWISLLLLAAAALILASEISYLSCWKEDASAVSAPAMSAADYAVRNSCGPWGARAADLLIRELFGYAAFIIPYTLLLMALAIAHIPAIKARRGIFPSVIAMCVISLFISGFVGRDADFFGTGPGGAMGIYITEWIKSQIGEDGTHILLVAMILLVAWMYATKLVIWAAKGTFRLAGLVASKIKASRKSSDDDFMYRDWTEGMTYPSENQSDAAPESPETVLPLTDDGTQPVSWKPEEEAGPSQPVFGNADEKASPSQTQSGTADETDEEEEHFETVVLPDGRLAALITEDYTLALDTRRIEEMRRSCSRVEKVPEDTEEDLFTITHAEETPAAEETSAPAGKPSSPEKQDAPETEPEHNEGTTTTTTIDGLVIAKTDSEKKVSDDDVNERTLYDPTLELRGYRKPTIDLLKKYDEAEVLVKNEEVVKNKNQIVDTLATFGIKISQIEATVGPTVTLYEIKPAPGVRISKIQNLEKDIALALAALGIRIIAPIPGKSAIGIEVPNRHKATVSMYSVIKSAKFHESKAELPIALGKTIQNETLVLDLAKMPHLLVAGATGQGKSVGLNAIITSLLYKKHPAELKFVMVDPKRLELTPYAALAKHFMAQMEGSDSIILTDTEKVVFTLNSICKEMDDRYKLLEDAGVKNLKEYNEKFIHRRLNPEKGHRFLPYLVVIVDEFADLIMTAGREIETPIARIAQLARAAGIHMIIATQRPTTNIITGTIKANFPARIAFRVTSYIDSKTILDRAGADQLIGRGDMLVQSGSDLVRVQCAFVDTPEVEGITKFIGAQRGYSEPYQLPEYQPETDLRGGDNIPSGGNFDPLLVEVARYVVDNQIGSTSKIQRNFEIGFNRAGRIVDQLESIGIVGKQSGSKPRQVLISDPVYLEHLLERLN